MKWLKKLFKLTEVRKPTATTVAKQKQEQQPVKKQRVVNGMLVDVDE